MNSFVAMAFASLQEYFRIQQNHDGRIHIAVSPRAKSPHVINS